MEQTNLFNDDEQPKNYISFGTNLNRNKNKAQLAAVRYTKDFQSIESPDKLLHGKLYYGDLRHFIYLQEDFFKDEDAEFEMFYLDNLRAKIKDNQYYDVAFGILVNKVLSKTSNRTLNGKATDINELLKLQKADLEEEKNLFKFDKSGIANTDYHNMDLDLSKYLKMQINALSILKLLKICDKFYGIREPKYNEDSINRYFNIFDLFLLDKENTIDRRKFKLEYLNIDFNPITEFLDTKEI